MALRIQKRSKYHELKQAEYTTMATISKDFGVTTAAEITRNKCCPTMAHGVQNDGDLGSLTI